MSLDIPHKKWHGDEGMTTLPNANMDIHGKFAFHKIQKNWVFKK
jgi:hypothetical protein